MAEGREAFVTAEPVVAGAGITGAVIGVAGAGIQLAQSFSVHITTAQSTAIMTFVAAVALVGTTWKSRRAVTANTNLEAPVSAPVEGGLPPVPG